jgi:adenylate cyclase
VALGSDRRCLWVGNRRESEIARDELSDFPNDDLRRAERLAAQALAASPNSALAHYAKGQVLRIQSHCNEAIPEFERAIALDRSRVPAYAHLGWCKFLTG